MLRPLKNIDILITIFNQEEIIERVLYGVLKNTTTPFNLILVFDGCTDRTKSRALAYLKKIRSKYLLNVSINETPDIYETLANNYGFKLSKSDYLITIQDDMVIREYGWEKRLTAPIRMSEDIFAVSGRSAQDLSRIEDGKEFYINQAAFEMSTLGRNIFAIRDIGIRGPLAFRMDYLKALNFLNEKYAPCALDDSELSLRAWRDKGWKIGVFGINYLSKKEWSKVSAPDSTMRTWETWKRNLQYIASDFKQYLANGVKHSEDITIVDRDVDYVYGFSNTFRKYYWILFFPLRFDRRRQMVVWSIFRKSIADTLKRPLVSSVSLFFGKEFIALEKEKGLKQAFCEMWKRSS